MEIMKRLQKKTICLMSSVIVIFGFMSCEKSGSDEQIIDADDGKMIEVPDMDTWVKDDDIKDGDLDLLVDLSVKVERMRQEFVLMFSNNGEGDKLFCGVGPQTDFDPTFKLITDMLEKQNEYKAALENLDKTAILKPTSTRGWVGNIWSILTTGMSEAEKEKEKVQEILTTNNVYGNATAQQQLYDFYCSQEPDYAKKIGAKDAKEFFNKLNNGELNSYMLNISHIWRDKGILEADKLNSAVGDYAYAAFTGKPEYLNSAYRVSSKVAVAAGELYFTAVDKIAGGYGDKIMEFGDALEKKITKLKLMKKFLEGKPDWEGVNKYVVDNLKDDIQNAISEALGDGDGIGKELIEQVSQEILDWVAEQCTSEDKGDGSAEAKEKIAEEAKADDVAIINIETDFSSQGKMIIVTDEATGKIHVATPTYDGHVTITTTPGNKLVTVIKKNGERLTKRMTAVAGSNTLVIKSEQAPYIDLNPSSISHEDDAGSETAVVLTNCKYVKLRVPNKEEWWSAQMEVNGSAGSGLHLRILYKANLEEKERSGSLILEGYKEKDDEKPSITKTVRFTQDPYSTKLEPIDVSPTSLSFGAQGGEQTVTIDYKKYKNCGGFNDEGSDDWLKVVTNSDGTLTVIASPNETGIERTGTVYAYATDLDHVETLDQAAFKIIPVTQSGNETAIEFNYIYLSYHFQCTGDYYDYREGSCIKEGIENGGLGPNNPTSSNIKKAITGNRIYFEVENKYGSDEYNYIEWNGGQEKYKGTEHIYLNIEAENVNDPKTYKIVDISFKADTYYEEKDSWYGNSTWSAEFVGLNLVYSPGRWDYDGNHAFYLEGTDIKSENIKQMSREEITYKTNGTEETRFSFRFKSLNSESGNWIAVNIR